MTAAQVWTGALNRRNRVFSPDMGVAGESGREIGCEVLTVCDAPGVGQEGVEGAGKGFVADKRAAEGDDADVGMREQNGGFGSKQGRKSRAERVAGNLNRAANRIRAESVGNARRASATRGESSSVPVLQLAYSIVNPDSVRPPFGTKG